MEDNKTQLRFPTEIVELPSKGFLYPPDHPLRKGTIEMKYMTAKEEDILSNKNYIEKGIVLDKLLESLTLNKFNLKEVQPGDRNAILIAARILGYGKNYSFTVNGEEYNVDLSLVDNKPFDTSLITPNGTSYYTLPSSGVKVEFKFLNNIDEEKIEEEIEGMKKINPDNSPIITTRLKYQIVSIDNDTDKSKIKDFVDNYLLANDSRSLRMYVKSISPDVNLTTKIKIKDVEEDINIPINLDFFWPDL